MENCILENSVGGCGYHETSGGNHYIKNCIFIQNTSGNDFCVYFRNAGAYYLLNCLIVRPSNRTPYNKGIFADWSSVYCYNTGVFGFLGFAHAWTSGDYNACDYSIGFGSNNADAVTYADQFEETSAASGTHDFRLKTGADLIDAGTDLSGDGITEDIVGNPRGATYDIGAWEVEEVSLSITGDASITLGAASLTAAGTLPIGGATTLTLSAVSLSAAGTLPLEGDTAVTLGAVSLVATGTLPLGGTATLTLSPATLTAAGTLPLASRADRPNRLGEAAE